ncbi:MAG: tetratricopeptide repeat protein [Bacteroidetes bacterium]|nr:tetratricopeptide repeat protein [Bacteroidota bacterium]
MSIEEIEEMLAQTEAALKADKYQDAESFARGVIDMLLLENQIKHSHITDERRFVFLSRANRLLSESFWRRGLAKDALVYAEKSLTSALDANCREEEAKSIGSIGIIYNILSDYTRALEYLNRALTIHEELGMKIEVAIVFGNIGMVYRNLSEPKIALKYYNESIRLYNELEYYENIPRVMNNLGLVYKDLADYPTALETYNKALKLCEKHNNAKSIESSVYANIGTVYTHLSDYVLALDYMLKALSVAEKLGKKLTIAQITDSIGLLYKELSDFRNSLEYHYKSLALYQELESKGNVAKAMGNIAVSFQGIGDYPKALENYLQAVRMFDELNMKAAYAIGVSNIGGLYHLLGEHTLALEYLEKGLHLHIESGSKDLEINTLGNIGTLYSTKECPFYDPVKAEKYLLKAIGMHEELGLKQHLYDNYLSLTNLYDQEGETEKALYYYKKYHELYIEVQNEEVKKQADKFGWEHKIADMEKEKEIEAIKTEANKKLLEQTIELQTVKIEAKTREVKSNVEELVKKNNFLHQIRTDLERVEPFTRQNGREIIEQLLDRITRNIKSFENIGSIKQQWEDVHGKFIRQLHEAYPKLTPTELKISALLKMNLTSSNITSIVFLSKRTVEFHRYNIRKKMNLPRKTDLNLLFNEMFSE